ncbi:phosphatidate cytidylyltransferase [Mesonia sp. K7]|uniref:phosphatidate cytidylyltransferase n=1 Tax=Mesonia sp. K7 TaxID=2218606 RepID=UPI000DA70E7C|nr:phosphatidate cytidylyltransferase [Mesonia sp. K7]PZD78320.1 phosphatidate cytidylyltransferase [Mesonia sp. K7]
MSDILKRSLSGLLYMIILISALLYSEISFLVLLFVFGIVAIYELQKLLDLNSYLSYFLFIALYGIFSFFRISHETLYIYLIITLLVKLLLIRDLVAINRIPLFERKKYILVIFYLIASFVFISKIPFQGDDYRPKILLAIFVMIWTNDTFAYLIGKQFGKRKLLERISPKKTIEGFLGGMIFTVLAGYVISLYLPVFTYKTWVFLGFFTSLFGTYGDLIQSKLKRQANVKDSGSIMPGHGGLLDRLDSILFAGTFIYTFLLIIDYVS